MAKYRILEDRIIEGNIHYIKCAGASTDTKPTVGICAGSWATETDTQTLYVFDEKSGEWKVFAEFGDGGE